MKKFTKGCLITALILFIIGCAFCATFGMMGGFNQINSMNGPYKMLRLGNLGNFVVGFNGIGFGIWDEDAWYDDWDEERWSEVYDIESSETIEKVQTNYGINDITNIDIELGGEKLIIRNSGDDYIWVGTNSGNNRIKYGKEGSTFKLHSTNGIRFGRKLSRGTVCLDLPRGMTLDSIDLEFGAGKMESIAMEADEISLDTGAGEFNIEGMKAREIDISIGAGKADIDSINATEADISVGAGSLSARGIDVRDLTIEVGMGNIDAEGKISGNADLECGMGSISMTLQGSEADHNYSMECAMGTIRIGDNKYSGLASERRVDNGSNSTFNVECAMGNIDIDFN